MNLIGIDGARRGNWVLAQSASGHDDIQFELTTNLDALFKLAGSGETLIVIDVPIGIASGQHCTAGRACDSEARVVVGPRRSSVFTPPCREAFGSQNQKDASSRNQTVCSRGVGCQAFGILSRIEQIDALMTPALQRNVREGHPEVSFAVLKGSPLMQAKKVQQGREERLAVLQSERIEFDVDTERLRLGRGLVTRDDIIDAAVMLVSARRVHQGHARRLGDGATDARGLLMQMWA
jgi:predicted RNase H-like nuclease